MLKDTFFLRLADLAACLRFLSRWPVPRLGVHDDPLALPVLPRAASMFPLAGAILAVPAAAVGALLSLTALPPLAIGLIMVALLAAPTGALHEDGLADTADGLIGGGNRERRLEIMKDSRIGTFGALALVVVIGLKATLYGALATGGVAVALAAPVAFGGLSRLAMVWLWHELPSARPDGLASRLGQPDFDAAVGASLAGLLVALPLFAIHGVAGMLLALGLAAASTTGLAALAKAKIGGQTGDVLGACQGLAETVLLVGLVAL